MTIGAEQAGGPNGAIAEARSNGKILAALDLGTNNCRLLIAEPDGADYHVIDSFSRIVRLGTDLARRGRLSGAAMRRATAAIKVCADKMQSHAVDRARCVTTGACRLAGNTEDFIAHVHQETGLALEVISSQEEARLAAAGAAPVFDYRRGHALIFDIGGGSTELIWTRLGHAGEVEVLDMLSVPVGVTNLAERHGSGDLRAQFDAMVDETAQLFVRFERVNRIAAVMAEGDATMIGTSGTTTTLAGIHLGLKRYDRSKVDGLVMAPEIVDRVTAEVRATALPRLAANGCVGRNRAQWVLPGTSILCALRRIWPGQGLIVADRGVRDGILRDMLLDRPDGSAKS